MHNRFRLILFIPSLVLLAVSTTVLHAQESEPVIIEGRVLDARSGEPMRGVHVFLSGTRIGSITNDAGRYRLSGIPAGAHRLVFSSIGYGRNSEDLLLRSGEQRVYNRLLEPVVYDLGELYVGNLDERWERYLQEFKQLFIGFSGFSDSVRILNPEVLRFERRWWGRLRAFALAPLIIENRALGYHITYYLDEFHHSGSITRWDGDYLFEEISPASPQEAEQWVMNRKAAFYGSFRHFLISLTTDRLDEEGFTIHRIPGSSRMDGRSLEYPVRRDRLLSGERVEAGWQMNFYGRLRVTYSGASEEARFPVWAGEPYRRPLSRQISYIRLNEHPVTIDFNGQILETYGVTQYGYFSFLRIANKTPVEFHPLKPISLTDMNP